MNLQADAMTRAAQMALRELKQKLRDEGCKATDERMHGLRKAIAEHLKSNPQILERAAMEVAAWRLTKITSAAQKLKR